MRINARNEWNPADYAVHLSRRARGLPFWFSLAVHGTDAYAEAIETTLAVTRQVAEEIRARPYLELLIEPELSVLVFRRHGWAAADYDAWSARLVRHRHGVRHANARPGRTGGQDRDPQSANDGGRRRNGARCDELTGSLVAAFGGSCAPGWLEEIPCGCHRELQECHDELGTREHQPLEGDGRRRPERVPRSSKQCLCCNMNRAATLFILGTIRCSLVLPSADYRLLSTV